MEYQTPGDIVERQQVRLRSAMRLALPAFGLALVALCVGYLGTALASRPVQMLGFMVGVAAVALLAAGFARTAWIIAEGAFRRR